MLYLFVSIYLTKKMIQYIFQSNENSSAQGLRYEIPVVGHSHFALYFIENAIEKDSETKPETQSSTR